MIDEVKVKQLTRKLKDQGDISVNEADEIYFQENVKSFELKRVMEEWYEVVAEKIRKGLRGNFVFTIDLHKDLDFMEPAQDAIRKHGNFEDLCDFIQVDKRLYSLVPFKHLFVEAAGIYDIPLDFYSFRNVREIKHCILAEFMKRKNIPCIIATALYDNKSILFVEEENAIVVKRVMEVPFEKLVENALRNKAIDKKVAKKLLVDNFIPNFSFDKFVKTSIEYIDETNEAKIKMMRNIGEEETEWLEEIR